MFNLMSIFQRTSPTEDRKHERKTTLVATLRNKKGEKHGGQSRKRCKNVAINKRNILIHRVQRMLWRLMSLIQAGGKVTKSSQICEPCSWSMWSSFRNTTQRGIFRNKTRICTTLALVSDAIWGHQNGIWRNCSHILCPLSLSLSSGSDRPRPDRTSWSIGDPIEERKAFKQKKKKCVLVLLSHCRKWIAQHFSTESSVSSNCYTAKRANKQTISLSISSINIVYFLLHPCFFLQVFCLEITA